MECEFNYYYENTDLELKYKKRYEFYLDEKHEQFIQSIAEETNEDFGLIIQDIGELDLIEKFLKARTADQLEIIKTEIYKEYGRRMSI